VYVHTQKLHTESYLT